MTASSLKAKRELCFDGSTYEKDKLLESSALRTLGMVLHSLNGIPQFLKSRGW